MTSARSGRSSSRPRSLDLPLKPLQERAQLRQLGVLAELFPPAKGREDRVGGAGLSSRLVPLAASDCQSGDYQIGPGQVSLPLYVVRVARGEPFGDGPVRLERAGGLG